MLDKANFLLLKKTVFAFFCCLAANKLKSFSPRRTPGWSLLPPCGNSPSVRGENTLTRAPWAHTPVTDVTGGGNLLHSR
jgi:hypothetical protein